MIGLGGENFLLNLGGYIDGVQDESILTLYDYVMRKHATKDNDQLIQNGLELVDRLKMTD